MSEQTVRWTATAAFALFVAAGAVRSPQEPLIVVLCLVFAVGATVAMTSTGWPLLAPATVAAGAVNVLLAGRAGNIGWFSLCLLAGWVTLRARTAVALSFLAVLTGLLAGQWTLTDSDPGWGAWIAGTVFTTVMCLMSRRQQELLSELRLAQAGLADRARGEERLRISRELHDVIAHSLTVSLLHVGSARLSVQDDDRAEAAAALEEAERLGRESLNEVRRAVGLMRTADGAPMLPAPGAEQISALLESFRRAGVPLDCRVTGDLSGVGPTLGLTTYRILQEALTNAVRHGSGDETRVRLDITADRIVLVVDNDCRTAVAATAPTIAANGHETMRDAAAAGEGIGLSSMQERARSVGGSLAAGPQGGGWLVRAELPARPDRSQASS